MLGPCKHRDVERLVPISLEAAVPADHFYRHLEATRDLGFVRDWVKECYAAPASTRSSSSSCSW